MAKCAQCGQEAVWQAYSVKTGEPIKSFTLCSPCKPSASTAGTRSYYFRPIAAESK